MKTHVRHAGQVLCPVCDEPLPPRLTQRPDGGACVHCDARLQVTAFPALQRDPGAGRQGAAERGSEEEAGCFYHPHKQALLPCDGCGRFLCALCDLELGARHLCPRCLEAGRREGRLAPLVTRRTLYDEMAFGLALYPLIFPFVTFLTAPLALFTGIRYRGAPGSLVPGTRWRLWLALLLATLQILAWIALVLGVWL